MTTNWFGVEEQDEPKPWTLADIYADLGARAEIARTLNVNYFRVQDWFARRERIHCPQPIRRIGNVDIYSMQEWKDWFYRWESKRKRDTKWTDLAKPHGSGKPFFTYDNNV